MTDTPSPTQFNYEEILRGLPCYLLILDRSLKVLWANSLVHQRFGASKGKTCRQLYQLTKAQCKDCPVELTFADGQVHSTEKTLTDTEGNRIYVLCFSEALKDDSGRPTHVVETSVDITSVKEIQKQLILLGQTVAGMAHSIKNIMMGLEGGIYVVNKGIEDDDRHQVKEGWEMVLLNFEKISNIVKDILYCSKERPPNLQRVDPNAIAREVYELFEKTAASYSVSLQLDLAPDLTDAILDPAGLHTVLSNLVANAIDACKMDIFKDEHLVEIRSKKGKDGQVIFEVADNGAGIDRKVKEHVFEDFFSSKGDKGTGLGLMVTQKIMREHGGAITFRSRPRQGTTFVVTFPQPAPREPTS
jgi:signal transduction histidine kinase